MSAPPMTARKGKKGAGMSGLEIFEIALIVVIWSSFVTFLVTKSYYAKVAGKFSDDAELARRDFYRAGAAHAEEQRRREYAYSREMIDHLEEVIEVYAQEIRTLGGTPPEVRRGRFRREQEA